MPRSTLFAGPFAVAALLALAGCAVGPHGRAAGSAAGRAPLTFESIFGPEAVEFGGRIPRDLEWLPDEPRYRQRRPDGVVEAVDAATGTSQVAYDVDALEAALAAHPAFDAGRARDLALRPTWFSPDRGAALLEHEQQLYFYRFPDQALTPLTTEAAERRAVTIAPSNDRVAFVRDNDLYAIDAARGQEVRLTYTGSDTLLNGVLDWVYQEEVYGRYNWRGYWWSPDGAHLAYLQLDDANVPVYPLVDYAETHPPVESLRYPKPGDPNPVVRLGVVPAVGGETVWVDLSRYAGVEPLIVHVSWSPGGEVVFVVQDREQRWLDLNVAEPQTGAIRTLLHEDSPAWAVFHDPPRWLDDGTFLWRTSRDGYAHLVRYAADGTLLGRLTEGAWDVRELLGVDEAAGRVYFTGTRDTVLRQHAYCVPLGGGEVQRLTTPGFHHDVKLDDTCRYFLDTFSNAATPPAVELRRADGALVRAIAAAEAPFLDEYAFRPPEFVRVPTPRGYALNATLLRPQKPRRGRSWPVMVFTYGGPGGPCVRDSWGGRGEMFKQLLAQLGVCVWTVDPHSASGDGAASAWQAYERLGATELADIETSLRWLAAREPVDLDRVGIEGHSYGGFMAAYALTHSDLFRVGIAAAPVTDWRLYDSIYTERFMRTPANNPEGYSSSSCVAAAADVRGRLLIAHGVQDDNVHVQNAIQLMDALQRAGRSFDVMLYPRDGHGLHRNGGHWNRLRYEYIVEWLVHE